MDETVSLIEGAVDAFTADVTDRLAMQRVFAEVEAHYGPVDILVNNAGVITPLGNDWDLDPDVWWRTLAVKLLRCADEIVPDDQYTSRLRELR